jgi:hypothetical protein
MALHIPGVGSQYAITEHDSRGEYLDGAKHYQLTVPPDVPAKDFWSVVVYDPQTRSEPQTGQAFPSRNNTRDPLATHATARSPSPSDRPHQTTTPTTGSKPSPARSGSPSCGSTAPSNPGSTRHGSPATSNRSDTD